eukprot:6175507-Pleurochrysis_carterae.AAC.3
MLTHATQTPLLSDTQVDCHSAPLCPALHFIIQKPRNHLHPYGMQYRDATKKAPREPVPPAACTTSCRYLPARSMHDNGKTFFSCHFSPPLCLSLSLLFSLPLFLSPSLSLSLSLLFSLCSSLPLSLPSFPSLSLRPFLLPSLPPSHPLPPPLLSVSGQVDREARIDHLVLVDAEGGADAPDEGHARGGARRARGGCRPTAQHLVRAIVRALVRALQRLARLERRDWEGRRLGREHTQPRTAGNLVRISRARCERDGVQLEHACELGVDELLEFLRLHVGQCRQRQRAQRLEHVPQTA